MVTSVNFFYLLYKLIHSSTWFGIKTFIWKPMGGSEKPRHKWRAKTLQMPQDTPNLHLYERQRRPRDTQRCSKWHAKLAYRCSKWPKWRSKDAQKTPQVMPLNLPLMKTKFKINFSMKITVEKQEFQRRAPFR